MEPKKSQKQIETELVRVMHVTHRRTKQPVILALIGITGSGLSTVARELSRKLHWSVIEKNKIRVKLREEGPGFTLSSTDRVARAMLEKVIREGGNAILDSDFVDKKKRRKFERLAKRSGAWVVYLRLVCDPDVMIERMLRSSYNPKTDIFGSPIVAVREHCRRYPWHYRWSPTRGGQHTLRKPPTEVLATVDTTDPARWKKHVHAIAKRLRRM